MGHSPPSCWPLKCSKYSRTCVNNSTPTQASQNVIISNHAHQKSWLQPHKRQRNLSWRCKLVYSWWPTVISQWRAAVKNVNDSHNISNTPAACKHLLRMSNYGAIEICDRVKTWLTDDPTALWHGGGIEHRTGWRATHTAEVTGTSIWI